MELMLVYQMCLRLPLLLQRTKLSVLVLYFILKIFLINILFHFKGFWIFQGGKILCFHWI